MMSWEKRHSVGQGGVLFDALCEYRSRLHGIILSWWSAYFGHVYPGHVGLVHVLFIFSS